LFDEVQVVETEDGAADLLVVVLFDILQFLFRKPVYKIYTFKH